MTTTTTTKQASPPSSTSGMILYDIGHAPPVAETCFAPNPWKSRFALNLKSLPYTTRWVRMPDIAHVRREQLGQPAGRQFADGQDFFTLPVLRDLDAGATLSDSFDIAVHLHRAYPDAGAVDLLPEHATLDFSFVPPAQIMVPLSERQDGGFPQYYRFNYNVDAAFSAHVGLMTQGCPFDPATADETKAEFVRRAGGAVKSWDEFALEGEARAGVMESFEKALRDLAKLFTRNDGGPFLRGEQACYADCIVGGWLRMAFVCLPREEWEALTTWHDGVFGRLWDALQAYAEVK